MAKPDKVFKQTHDWFRASVTQAASTLPPGQRVQAEQLVWQMLGVLNAAAPAADPNIEDFKRDGGNPATARAVKTAALR